MSKSPIISSKSAAAKIGLGLLIISVTSYIEQFEVGAVLVMVLTTRRWPFFLEKRAKDSFYSPLVALTHVLWVGLLSAVLYSLMVFAFEPVTIEPFSILAIGRLTLFSILGTTICWITNFKSRPPSVQRYYKQAIMTQLLVILLFFFGNIDRFSISGFPEDDLHDLVFYLFTLNIYWLLLVTGLEASKTLARRLGETKFRISIVALSSGILLVLDYLINNLYLHLRYQTPIYADFWVMEMPLKLILLVVISYALTAQLTNEKVEEFSVKAKVGKVNKRIGATQSLFFCVQHQNTYVVTEAKEKLLIDESLSDLERVLLPYGYFRLNRQILAKKEAIQSFESIDNRKLRVQMVAVADLPVTHEISRLRAPEFKRWFA